MSYLLDYNPGTPQYTYPRRGGAKLSGTAIIHTAECAMDLDGDDTSAEVCASFIANRADYGSYHRLVDSDSIIDMVPWEYEAWQDSETNNWAVGISAAVQAGKWHSIPAARRDRIYRNMAACAADFVRHMAGKGVTVPLVRISGAQARARVPGFCAHGDSGLHRSDPGAQFDWALFFRYTAEALGGNITPQGTTTGDEDMPLSDDDLRKVYEAVWYGAPGARLIPNEANGGGEWPYTTLGSLTARISRDVIRPQLADLKGAVSAQAAISPAEVADAVIDAVGADLAAQVVTALGQKLGGK